jgi:uncharacterized protein YhaN
MKLLALDLLAFGPFTDRRLDFGEGDPGLHVVYGPNEAGKSSALRALRSLFYGIPARTADDFVHPKDRLRLGGRLRAADGSELAFIRRKGLKRTLLTPDQEPLDEAVLSRFLQGLQPEVFETLFGIDHAALVRGGEEILEEQGEVGQALFAAGLGTAELHTVLGALEARAEALFLARGTNPRINAGLRDYRDATQRLSQASLPSREWEAHRHALEQASRELEGVQGELTQSLTEMNRLQRLRRVLPTVARRRDLWARLEQLGEVHVLADDFGQRRQETEKRLAASREVAARAAADLERQREALARLSVSEVLLDQAETIEALHQRLDTHRKAVAERPERQAELGQLQADASGLLRELRPELSLEQAGTLRPLLGRRRRVQELGNLQQALAERVSLARRTAREREEKVAATRQVLAELPEARDPQTLRQAVEAARRAGDLEGTLAAGRGELRALTSACADDLCRLGLWAGDLADLTALPVPPPEAVDRFARELDGLRQALARLEERKAEAERERLALEQELSAIRLADPVPSEEDLAASREQREQGWRLLRRQWIDGEDVSAEARSFDPERSLPEAYEARVAETDGVADRLRREGDRVHHQASLQAGCERWEREQTGIEAALHEKHIALEGLEQDWRALWRPCGIEPWVPGEMRGWLHRQERLREKVLERHALEQRVQGLEARLSEHRQSLADELNGLGEAVESGQPSLARLVSRGEAVLEELEGIERTRDALSVRIAEEGAALRMAREDEREASAALAEWQSGWTDSVEPLGLAGNASPTEVNDVLDNLSALFTKLDKAEEIRGRMAADELEVKRFADEVRGLAARTGPELAAVPAEQAVVQLQALLGRNRDEAVRRTELERQVAQTQSALREAEAAIQTMEARLAELCREAGCASPDELDSAQRLSDEVKGLRRELHGLERQLVEEGAGAPLEALEAEAAGVDADSLPARTDALTRRIQDELEPRRNALFEEKGREETELKRMDGGARAVEIADEREAILARVGHDAESYVRLRLAALILREQIERYRQENQGPLLDRASDHFTRLTLGSFTALRAEFDAKDRPVLAGVRPTQQPVRVEGMSSGTRDQLYLSLRLASLERYLEQAEPMPFIVDDILIHFDDARSAATLGTLAELAAKTQVILFTHHARLVEQARALRAPAGVFIHTLDADPKRPVEPEASQVARV